MKAAGGLEPSPPRVLVMRTPPGSALKLQGRLDELTGQKRSRLGVASESLPHCWGVATPHWLTCTAVGLDSRQIAVAAEVALERLGRVRGLALALDP